MLLDVLIKYLETTCIRIMIAVKRLECIIYFLRYLVRSIPTFKIHV